MSIDVVFIAEYVAADPEDDTEDFWDNIEEGGPEDLLNYLDEYSYLEEALPRVKYANIVKQFEMALAGDLPVDGEMRLIFGYYEYSESYSLEWGKEYDSWFTATSVIKYSDPEKQRQALEDLASQIATNGLCSQCRVNLVDVSWFAKERKLCAFCADRQFRKEAGISIENPAPLGFKRVQ